MTDKPSRAERDETAWRLLLTTDLSRQKIATAAGVTKATVWNMTRALTALEAWHARTRELSWAEAKMANRHYRERTSPHQPIITKETTDHA